MITMKEYRFSFSIQAESFDKAKMRMLHPSNLVKMIKNDDNWTSVNSKNITDAYAEAIQSEVANQTVVDPLLDVYIFGVDENE